MKCLVINNNDNDNMMIRYLHSRFGCIASPWLRSHALPRQL